MISSWICWVPSKMSRIFASRAHFSSSSSSPRPADAAERDAAQRDVDARSGRPWPSRRRRAASWAWSCRPSRRPPSSAVARPRSRIRARAARRRRRAGCWRGGRSRPRPRPRRAARGCARDRRGRRRAPSRRRAGRVLSKVRITPPKPFLVSISGLPSRSSLGTRQSSRMKAAVSEARMPSLCSRRSSFRPGFERSTTKDLIAARPTSRSRLAQTTTSSARSPDGDVDLLAVEDVLVAVELGRRADRGRVGAGLGLGDRHRRPLAGEALLLVLVGDRGDGRVAEALARHRQQQADVAPAHLDDREDRRHVGAVAVAAVAVLLGLADAGGAGAARCRRPRRGRR